MILLEVGELEEMRTTQAESFWDTCELLAVVETRDETGEEVQSWPEASDPLPCRLDMSGGEERRDREATLLIVDALLYLSLETELDVRDRVRITHRHGEELLTPLVYGIAGYPQRGPTALCVKLKEVTL